MKNRDYEMLSFPGGEPEDSSSRAQFLNQRRLPAVLYDFQAAWMLDCHPDRISDLINAGLLVPLGGATEDDAKRFARETLLRLATNLRWLDEVSAVIYRGAPPEGKQAKSPAQDSDPAPASRSDAARAESNHAVDRHEAQPRGAATTQPRGVDDSRTSD
jgi:hypothetical protein